MEPDGTIKITYVSDMAAGIKGMLAALEQFDKSLQPLTLPGPPSNERPWHKHTLPNRKKRR